MTTYLPAVASVPEVCAAAARRDPSPEPRAWVQVLARYREPDTRRSVLELAITALPFAALWTLSWFCLHISVWLSLLLAVPTAGFLIRLFMIQHDCGHSAFFRRRRANDWVGRVIGVLTLTPYDSWRQKHAIHHASSGNLDKRGIGDVQTLTVREYRSLSRWRRFQYRLFRHPVFMFGVAPTALFLINHRLPFGQMRSGLSPWLSTMLTNLGIAAGTVGMMALVGVGPFLIVHGPVVLLAASVGVWMFYVQHQFEDTYWAESQEWSVHDGALHGSSYYDLPGVLRWFTANIGVHHVHHLASRIPSYRLPEVLRAHPELKAVNRLTLWQSLRCVRLALWDEERRRLVSFREATAAA